jgi:hypothetical protein
MTDQLNEISVSSFRESDSEVLAIMGLKRLVDSILARAKKEARNNPWVEASLESIERYARDRDRGRMAKEARYTPTADIRSLLRCAANTESVLACR